MIPMQSFIVSVLAASVGQWKTKYRAVIQSKNNLALLKYGLTMWLKEYDKQK